MGLPENVANTLRRVFDDGLDEVLIFAFIFIFILLTGHEGEETGNDALCGSVLPIVIIGVFLLLYIMLGRTANNDLQG